MKHIAGACLIAGFAFTTYARGQTTQPLQSPAAQVFALKDDNGNLVTLDPAGLQFTPGTNVQVHPTLTSATFLGVEIAPADTTLQAQLKLPEGVGLVVRNLTAKGPAEIAGLQKNDVISRLDDQIVVNAGQFEVLIRMHKAGDTVTLTLFREAQERRINVVLTEHEMPSLMWMMLNGEMNLTPTTLEPGKTGTLILSPKGGQ